MKIIPTLKHYIIDNPVWLIRYIKARLLEKSTWVGISGGVAAAAALSPPWSFVTIAIAAIMAILPTSSPENPS